MPEVQAGDITVRYAEQGSGPPLLCLMGLGGSSETWGDAFLGPLAARARVIAPDPRGSGGAERGEGPYTIARLADDAAALLDALGIARADVLGVSMGGMAAQELALRHPARVARLVLGCTWCGGPHAIRPWGERPSAPTSQRPTMPGTFGAMGPMEALRRAMAGASGPPPSPRVIGEQMAAVLAFDSYDRLPAIRSRTLVITGDADPVIPPENARVLARRIPDCEGVIVRGAGHMFFWDAPERAAGAIAEFLGRLD